ncbi:unnamed protein product [Ixodes pacificus]
MIQKLGFIATVQEMIHQERHHLTYNQRTFIYSETMERLLNNTRGRWLGSTGQKFLSLDADRIGHNLRIEVRVRKILQRIPMLNVVADPLQIFPEPVIKRLAVTVTFKVL